MSGSDTNWGAINGAAALLSIAAGLIYFYMEGDWLPAIGIPITIFGAYELISSFVRNREEDRWGTSDSGAAAFFGFTFIAIGGAVLIYHFMDSIVIALVFAVVLGAVYLLLKAMVKKNA